MQGEMKAMVLHNWVEKWGDNLKLEKVPIPTLGSHDVLVKVKACGVGGTVSNFMMGEMSRDPKLLPKTPGDEIAGEVAEIGSQVQGLAVGDRVIVYLFITCGKCKFCLTGRNDLCVNFAGWIGRHKNGGYAEYAAIPDANLFKLPDGIPFVEATTIITAIASAVHALRSRAQVTLEDDVMIVGAAGGVGVHAVQLAKVLGGRVFAVDTDDEKLRRLKEYGADFLINANSGDVPEQVKKLTAGKGVDVVIDFVGSPKTLVDSTSSLGRGGRLVNLTTHPGVKFEVSAGQLVLSEIIITGSRYTTKHEFLEAIELVRTRRIKPVVTQTARLEDVEKLHVLINENKLFGRAALAL
jgi:propanol-preferring alcohol dehydrogenase